MAITSGKITHDGPEDFSNPTYAQNTDASRLIGGVSIEKKSDGGYPFFADYVSNIIDLTQREATSLKQIKFSNSPWDIEADTIDLFIPSRISGTTIANSVKSAPGGAVTGLYNLQPGGMMTKANNTSSRITTTGGPRYELNEPLVLEVRLDFNNGPGREGGRNVFFLGNYSASGGGIELRVNTHGALWSPVFINHAVIATMKLESGDTLSVTANFTHQRESICAAIWDGTRLGVFATSIDGTVVAEAYSAPASAAPKASSAPMVFYGAPTSTEDFAGGTGITQTLNPSFAGFKIHRNLNFKTAIPPKLSDTTFTRSVALTRTAASSGGFTNNWKGASADGNYPISDMKDLSFLNDNDLTDTKGGTAISSPGSVDPASKAFDNNFVSPSYWTTGTLGSNVKDKEWIGWDFGEGNEQTISSVFFYQTVSTTMVSLVRIEKSADGATWDPIIESSAKEYLNRITFPSPETARCFRILARSGAGGGTSSWRIYEAGFCSPPTIKASPLGGALTAYAMDESGVKFTRAQATSGSNGYYLPVLVKTAGAIPAQDFVKLSMACDNPNAIFRLNLHSSASFSPLNPASPTSWSYSFKVNSSEWKDFFFPDFSRASFPDPSAGSYWLTLEIVDAAGGCNLDLRDMRFGKGLQSGDLIQSPFGPFLQYRLILLTNS